MPVPSLVTDLSTTIASNSPAGSDNVFPDLDNHIRALAGILASVATNSATNGYGQPYLPNASAAVFNEAGADLDFRAEGDTDANLLFLDASTDRIGIGTNTPDAKLTVSGVAAVGDGAVGAPSLANTGDLNTGLWFPAADTVAVSTGGVEACRLDSSGNLGLGVTPSAWGAAGQKALQLAGLGAVSGGYDYSISASNNAMRVSGGGWQYMLTGQLATLYQQISGTHTWSTAPSGTAGNAISFTQAMTLDASGNLLVGMSSPEFVSTQIEVKAATNKNALGARTTQNNYAPLMAWNSATTGDNLFQYFYTEGTLTLRGSIDYNRAGGLVRYNTTSDYRAKDIIGPVQNPGATIDALKVYEGVMKGATQSRPMLIAHEAQEHVPFCVSGEKDEENEDGTPRFQQMDHASLVPLLLAEIQSLRARVAALEAA